LVNELLHSFLRSIHSLHWYDALDILVVSWVIYKVILIIKGTRAFRMIIGLLLIVVFSLLSKWAKLQTIDWLFQHLWQVGLFTLIVLFQPELRRMLADMGAAPLTAMGQLQKRKVVEEIVAAVEHLRERGYGALIAIERHAKLDPIVETGVAMNSPVNRDILATIFYPKTPLHDGAVVIRDDRIIAARCLLPLSSTVPNNSLLGTRHRAAIGLAEETDAVVVVVSEERMEVSVVVGGKLTKVSDSMTLSKVLSDLLLKEEGRLAEASSSLEYQN
jgi:diadenylate cyclase